MAARLSYSNKVMLAPMVRIGTLPTRLLALEYGADIVYSEELIDHRMVQCQRLVNPILDTVDFVSPDGRCMFRTCEREKKHVVFQMGTADSVRAVETAKLVERDVAGIDVNMGCPKDFSLKGGMGAALLSNPERVRSILTSLVSAVSLPVTCKIRLLPTPQATFDLVKVIESTGVAAVAVHGRSIKERSTQPCHYDVIREIVSRASIPVIANGGSNEITSYKDVDKIKSLTGCESVMIARAAQWNPSVFRREGALKIDDVIKRYLQLAVDTGNGCSNTKYCVCQMMADRMEGPLGARLHSAKNIREICDLWGMTGYHDAAEARRSDVMEGLSLREQKSLGVASFSPGGAKRQRMDAELTEEGVMELCVKYERRDYPAHTPKSELLEHCSQRHLDPPSYNTVERSRDRLFKSVLTVCGDKYSSSFWLKSKKSSEQAAAIVALAVLGLDVPTKQ
ncbi:tRNA-dihydrouridine(20) synthase [NAD(P)+]-like [Halichondria panicea]|uniref:tRNA-dihydrouridine(20) synthase [NAD(P)+]-like n=1 Tax=Halichondria panicea TaxID=6063 RepID=UPI00312B907B